MPNLLDAIGSLSRVAFEEVYIPDMGSIQTFEADIQIEADGCDYVFRALRIYTHQTGKDGDGFFTAKLDTSTQQRIALALKSFVEGDAQYERLCELADEEGLRAYLMEAA
jgi:hypothetical protein